MVTNLSILYQCKLFYYKIILYLKKTKKKAIKKAYKKVFIKIEKVNLKKIDKSLKEQTRIT